MTPDDPRHGEERGYSAHIKAGQKACAACTRAHSIAEKKRIMLRANGTPRSIPAVGTKRRIQALSALGWSRRAIALAAGFTSAEAVSSVLRREHVGRETARRIDRAYEQLSGSRGPSNKSRSTAARYGWAPPLAWDDIDDPNERPRGYRLCTMLGCARAHVARGLCSKHYKTVVAA